MVGRSRPAQKFGRCGLRKQLNDNAYDDIPMAHQIPQPAQAAAAGGSGTLPRARASVAPTPVMSYTPTDTSIPPSLEQKVPNLELYKRLKEAERKIDLLVTRKALDLQALQSKVTQPSLYKRHTGTLRVFIYNTCENQPWQKKLMQEQSGEAAPGEPSTWTLRVEGRLLDKQDQPTKFSSFLSGISVDLHPPAATEAQANPSQPNIIEWRDASLDGDRKPNLGNPGAHLVEFDGLDVKRNGIFNVPCKIAILPKLQTASLKLSKPMAHFVGRQEATQQDLIFIVWQYVLHKSLLKTTEAYTRVPAVSVAGAPNGSGGGTGGADEGDDLRVVECDAILQSLFGVPSFKFLDLFKLIQPHLLPRDSIVLDYEIDTSRSTTLGDLVIDIPVDLPPTLSEFQQGVIETSKQIFEKLAASDAHIQRLDGKIALGVVALQNASAKEIFYRELSQDPVTFLEKWLETQLETLKVLKSDEGYDEEVVRRSEYYEKNEDLLRDNINVLLGSGKV